MTHSILADGRWSGPHGIGRFSQEILSRLNHTTVFTQGPSPLSLSNMVWLPRYLARAQHSYGVYFSPGYMPPVISAMPFVFTIHDLIHLYAPDNGQWLKRIAYNTLIKPAIHRAAHVITVSEYSKNQIMAWSGISNDKISVIYNGISPIFSPEGKKHAPGYAYFFYPGHTKPHKNVPRLISAFGMAKIDPQIKLILTAKSTPELQSIIEKAHLTSRIILAGTLTETELAEYYRGALGLLFPSLYEGFGLPVIEAMASGIPVITSNTTSLPEVAGDAAILINPLDKDALAFHIEQLTTNRVLRQQLIDKGLTQANRFSWDESARQLQRILNHL